MRLNNKKIGKLSFWILKILGLEIEDVPESTVIWLFGFIIAILLIFKF